MSSLRDVLTALRTPLLGGEPTWDGRCSALAKEASTLSLSTEPHPASLHASARADTAEENNSHRKSNTFRNRTTEEQ